MSPISCAELARKIQKKTINAVRAMSTSEAIQRAIDALQYRRELLDRDIEIDPGSPISKIMAEGSANDRDAIRSLNELLRQMQSAQSRVA